MWNPGSPQERASGRIAGAPLQRTATKPAKEIDCRRAWISQLEANWSLDSGSHCLIAESNKPSGTAYGGLSEGEILPLPNGLDGQEDRSRSEIAQANSLTL